MPLLPILLILPALPGVHKQIDASSRINFAGTMYHASSGITYAARKSKAPARYLLLLLFTEQTYPFPFCISAIVHFTCTPTNFPGRPTTQSKLPESPNALLTGSPFSAARTTNTDSAHSPRCLF